MKPNFQANQVFHFLLAAQEPLLLNPGNCVPPDEEYGIDR